jgi:iron complex transport system substrate-binding protein
MKHPQRRVVSLLSSATEIVYALGLEHTLVARSHECDYPECVFALPQLTTPRFPVEGTSLQVDKAVRALVENGLAVYAVDAAALAATKPDVILTQDQCAVCAVSLADVERAVCDWIGPEIKVVSLRPHTLGDVASDVMMIAEALGVPERGAALNEQMAARFQALAARVGGRRPVRLAFIEWIDPPMSGGHWMPELIAIAGGVSVMGTVGATSPWITWDEVAATDPDVIVVAPCGYGRAKAIEEMGPLAGVPAWQGLRAVRENRVFVADGNAYFNRPGPRLVESAEILAEICHPDVVPARHLNVGYARYKA